MRLVEAIDVTTISIYLVILKHFDTVTFTAAVLFLMYKKDFRLWAFASAILCFSDAYTIASILGSVLILFYKPCDFYTFAVIVSVLLRMLLVTLRLIFNILLSLF